MTELYMGMWGGNVRDPAWPDGIAQVLHQWARFCGDDLGTARSKEVGPELLDFLATAGRRGDGHCPGERYL